jgi:hypothetical protein
MVLTEELEKISEVIDKKREMLLTEESTKTSLIMPFLKALEYNIFDPEEVIPEFNADVGTKKDEKVDYAIMMNGEPIILMECKSCGYDLDKTHAAQLCRYFTFTKARFGVLTNGIVYRFFTDIDEPNIMDTKPFFELDLSDLKDSQVEELKKFTKTSFDLPAILNSASELKYLSEMKKIMEKEMSGPSTDFVKFFAKQVYKGPLTEKVRIKFTDITKTALNQVIKEKVNARLKSALNVSDNQDINKAKKLEEPKKKVVTTKEEWEGYYIVKAILSELIDVDRVYIRDNLSYCGIFLDNKNTKTICRLRFNTSQKYLGLINEDRKEEKIPIESVNDLYKYSEQLKSAVNSMDGKK